MKKTLLTMTLAASLLGMSLKAAEPTLQLRSLNPQKDGTFTASLAGKGASLTDVKATATKYKAAEDYTLTVDQTKSADSIEVVCLEGASVKFGRGQKGENLTALVALFASKEGDRLTLSLSADQVKTYTARETYHIHLK